MNENIQWILALIILSFVIYVPFYILNEYRENNYWTTGVLHNQWLDNEGKCCDGCLIFNISEFVCCGQSGDECGCEYKNKTFYFAGEYELRDDLLNNTNIVIRWKYIKNIDDWRIKGIYPDNMTAI